MPIWSPFGAQCGEVCGEVSGPVFIVKPEVQIILQSIKLSSSPYYRANKTSDFSILRLRQRSGASVRGYPFAPRRASLVSTSTKYVITGVPRADLANQLKLWAEKEITDNFPSEKVLVLPYWTVRTATVAVIDGVTPAELVPVSA